MRRPRLGLAVVMGLAAALAAPSAEAKTCTKEFSDKEFAGNVAVEIICDTVAVRLLPIQSEMYYRRWSGEVEIRTLEEKAFAKISLAAFDAAGNLVGTWTYSSHKIEHRPKTVPLQMDPMFISLTEAKKILIGVSLPDRKSP